MIKKFLALLIISLLVSCDGSIYDSSSYGTVKFTFSMASGESAELRDLNFFAFDGDGELQYQLYVDDYNDINSKGISLKTGYYTFAAALNCGEQLTFEEDVKAKTKASVTLNDFKEWMQEKAGNYYDAYTGTTTGVVYVGSQTFNFSLNDIEYSYAFEQQFIAVLPSSDIPAFISTRDSDDQLRVLATIESTRASDFETTQRAWLYPTDVDNEYSFSLSMFEGSYSVALWIDYGSYLSDDKYYNTEALTRIAILDKENYIANTSQKDGFAAYTTVSVEAKDSANMATVEVEMMRPLAKYNIIATDVEIYNKLQAADESLPAIEDLSVKIYYEGYLPYDFSLTQLAVSNAQLGYSYDGTNIISNGTMLLASDYVFATVESFSDVTIVFSDSKGNIVSSCSGLRVSYAGDMESTVYGEFLTCGLEGDVSGGIGLETEWDEDINFRF